MNIIIIGGGITGALLALAISSYSNGKIQISLIEIKLPDKTHYNFINARTIALAYNTCQQLNQIGVWNGLRKYMTPITSIHISGVWTCWHSCYIR